MVAAAQPLTLAAEADLLRPVEDVKGPDSFDAPAPTPSTLTFGFGWQPSPAQLRLRDDCSRWAEVRDHIRGVVKSLRCHRELASLHTDMP